MQSYVERKGRIFALSAALVLAGVGMVLIACAVGSARLPLASVARAAWEALRGQEPTDMAQSAILLKVRLPRALLAYVAGAALSVSGCCMQGLFKNAMADPHILGVSSGSALGATVCIVLGWQKGPLGMATLPIMAFVTGTASVFLVINLARTRGRMTTVSLLLAGVAVSACLSSLISLLMILNHDKMENVLLWTMGSFTSANNSKLTIAAPVIVAGIAALSLFARDLNAMLLGEEEARALGVRVARTRMLVLVISTLITATGVAMSGVIGFVGLMVPHTIRMVVGPDHRAMIPVSALSGGVYLLLMDTLARTLAMPMELPVGVLTAFVGGPFFLYLLRRNKG